MIFSVGQVVKSLRRILTQNPYISNLQVRGELFEANISGSNVFFSLIEKNEGGNQFRLNFMAHRSIFNEKPYEELRGKNVVVSGELTMFNSSSIHIKASSIKEENEGNFQKMLEELDKKCKALGYYDAPKKIRPKFCFNIGVVTSQTGAAIGDISQSLKMNKYVRLYIHHAKVQGKDADIEIAKGIRSLDKMNLDAIIVGRGGGSKSDLIAFNSEIVIESIFNAKTLIASAVGHQRDTFIIDKISDICFITPTDAAKELIGSQKEVDDYIRELFNDILQLNGQKIDNAKKVVELFKHQLEANSPKNKLFAKRAELEQLKSIIDSLFVSKIGQAKQELEQLNHILTLQHPKYIYEKYVGNLAVISDLLKNRINTRVKETRKEFDILHYELEKNSPIGKLENGTMIAVVNGSIVTDTRKLEIGDTMILYSKTEELVVRIEDKKLNAVITREDE